MPGPAGGERSYGVPDELLTEVPWSLQALRRWWNLHKDELAPWWEDNSKEAYSSGLDALARGLKQWTASRSGKRRGPRMGFPRCRYRRRSRMSCRFTTGAIRVGDGTHVVLPRMGRVKTHERTTALLDKVTAGQARVLAAAVSFDGRRWYCAFTVESSREPGRPAHIGVDRAHPVVGVDAGVRDLLVVASRAAPRWPGCPRRAAWPRTGAAARGAAQSGPAGRPGQAYRAARLEPVPSHLGTDRAHPRPRREHPP